MDPSDFFRRFFGFQSSLPSTRPGSNDNEKQNWDDGPLQDQVPSRGPAIKILEPLEMDRFFNQQIEDMMRNFFGLSTGFNTEANFDFHPSIKVDNEEGEGEEGCREFMLKEGSPLQDGGGYAHPDGNRVDQDVRPEDVSPDQLHQLFKSQQTLGDLQDHHQVHQRSIFSTYPFFINPLFGGSLSSQNEECVEEKHTGNDYIYSFGQSSTRTVTQNPDGSTEERTTVRDSNGNTKIIITKKNRNGILTQTTVKRPDGSQETEESGIQSKFVDDSSVQPSPRDEMMKNERSNFENLYRRFFGSQN